MCVYPLVNGSPLASINTNSNGGCNTWGYDVRLQSQMLPTKTRTISSRRRCFNESNIFKYAKIFSLDFQRTGVTNYFATRLNFLPI